MDWELYDGTKTVGPASEADVVQAIRQGGLTTTILVRRVGEQEWRGLRTHPPFAMALETRGAQPAAVSTAPGPNWKRIGGAVAVGTVVLVLVVAVIKLGQSSVKSAAVQPEPQQTAATPAPAPPPSVKPPESLGQRVMAATTLASAVALSRPEMRDVRDELNTGSVLLSRWLAEKGKWVDVAVANDETSHAKVQKDSVDERGKRYCASGTIIQIERVRFEGGKVDIGLLMDDSMRLWHFISAGESGSLVAKSHARLCGFVTGKYVYQNSAGGTGHAVDIVGFFDLPENRKR